MKASSLLPVFLLLGAATVLFSACNTVKGFGEDLEAAGEAIQNSGEEND